MTPKTSEERFEEWLQSLPFKIREDALPTHCDAWQAQESYYTKLREELKAKEIENRELLREFDRLKESLLEERAITDFHKQRNIEIDKSARKENEELRKQSDEWMHKSLGHEAAFDSEVKDHELCRRRVERLEAELEPSAKIIFQNLMRDAALIDMGNKLKEMKHRIIEICGDDRATQSPDKEKIE